MRRARQLHEAAAGDRPVRFTAVLDRDGVVAPTPDDQRRHRVEQVQPVEGTHSLAAPVDYGAQALDERLARAGLLERAERPGDGLQVDALPKPRAVRAVDLNGFAQPEPRPQQPTGRNVIPCKIIKATE